MFTPKSAPSNNRRGINIVQGSAEGQGFKRGYQSFVTDTRTPHDALNDMTNIDLDQDNLPRPRPSLALFGGQPLGAVLGVGTFVKTVSGQPEKWDISMQVIGGVGKVHVRKDGGTWVAATGANTYSATATVNFCQSGNRVYVSNAVNAMSYYNIATGGTVEYVTLSTPTAPSAVQTGMAGTDYTYYYRVSANNAVGESAASSQATVQTSTIRGLSTWSTASKYVTVTWSAISGSPTSYNVYVGIVNGEEQYLATVTGLKYVDDGQTQPNALKIASSDNSTAGPVLTSMWNKDGRLWGVGDTTNPDYVWYDGGSEAVGDFSPFNGGGSVRINPGGDTVPVSVRGFRTGKGDSAVTVLSRGIAGIGKMHHVVLNSFTFDGQSYDFYGVVEANGQGGTTSANAVVELNNSLWYPTGQDFKTTGTSPNVQNILTTNSISNDIISDVNRINLAAMSKACGLAYQGRIYWALPVSSSENNQIWIKDLTRKGVWILPWTIKAKFMWLSENNTTGQVDMCIYDGTNILTFTRSVMTQDNGVAFKTRVAHEGLVWSESGMTMGAIQDQKFKLLQPSGKIQINSFGVDEDGAVDTLAVNTFTQTASFTGWNQLDWFNDEWSGDIGLVNYVSTQVEVTTLEIDEILNQVGWEIITDTIGCDYYLSGVLTRGIEITNSFYGD